MKRKPQLLILLMVSLGFCALSVAGVARVTSAFYSNRQTAPKRVELKTETAKIKLGETELQVLISEGKTAKPFYFNMHDNESTSVEAAKKTVEKRGGKIVEIAHTGKRLITFKVKNKTYTIDPNRIFTSKGIAATLKKNGASSPAAEAEVEKFAKELLAEYLSKTDLIVALHNNTNDAYSAKSYEKGGEYASDAAQVYINPANDVDDFFFVTDAAHFRKLKEKGFNVILQDNSKVADDGSLSVYCGQKNIKYINVEAQHGHLEQQVKMLEALSEILKDKPE